MSFPAQTLRARLAGAVNQTVSVLYGRPLPGSTRRGFVAIERLEERIVFGRRGRGT